MYPKIDMVLISLISYWLPVACQSEEERRKSIRSCLYRLALHQQYLESIMSTDEYEKEPENQYIKPLKAKSENDHLTTIEESKNI